MSTDQPRDASRSGSLARRFFAQVALVSVGMLLVAGSVEAVFGYREALSQMARLQGLQAQAAVAEIEQYLQTVQRVLQPVQALPWGQPSFGTAQRREELHRALSLNPSVVSLTDLDETGAELLAISRVEVDRLPAMSRSLAPPVLLAGQGGALPKRGFGVPFFDKAAVPNVELVLPRAGQPAGRTVAVINLSFLGDVLASLRLAEAGDVYLVDAADRLIAHADPTQVLRLRQPRTDNAVAVARASLAASAAKVEGLDAPGLNGARAITTAIALREPPWTLFVEQAHAQAMQPVWATLQRTLLLVAAAGAAAMLASAAFARRMASPIARLREATAGMAAGQLLQRVQIKSGDEIESLAEDFNSLSARLQQSYGELEQKVEQRTAELALRRDEAERANAAKTRFLASASHDLRQPMHAIGLLVGVLRERLAEKELQGLADKTHQAVQAMEGLFGRLLDVSKLDAGAVRPQPGTFAMQALLERVAASYAPLAAAKGIRLRVRPTSWVLRTDPELLERVVGNLVSNAIRYTRAGGVVVSCRRRASGLYLQVIDSGIGIPADQQELIFEEFVRLDSSHGAEQGLGLGLAIVRRTAALLGLTIRVKSRLGHGSSFELSLPNAEAAPAPVALPAVPADLRLRVAGAFVLVVDDDVGNLEATAALLLEWGCLVAKASTGESAVQEAEQHLRPPDIVITDLRLGSGWHGIELIRQLRAQSGLAIPALLVTADTQLPEPADPNTQVLQKPVGSVRLLEALVQSLPRLEPI